MYQSPMCRIRNNQNAEAERFVLTRFVRFWAIMIAQCCVCVPVCVLKFMVFSICCCWLVITGTSIMQGDGMYEGMDWLSATLREGEAKKRVMAPLESTAKEIAESSGRLSSLLSWLRSSSSWWTDSEKVAMTTPVAA